MKKALALMIIVLISLPLILSTTMIRSVKASPIFGLPKMNIDVYGDDVLESYQLKDGGYGIVFMETGIDNPEDFTGYLLVRLPRFLEPTWMTEQGEAVAFIDIFRIDATGMFLSYDHSELQTSTKFYVDPMGGTWYLFGIETTKVSTLIGYEYACVAFISLGVHFTGVFATDEVEAFILPYIPTSPEQARNDVAKNIIMWGIRQELEHVFETLVLNIPSPWSVIINIPSILEAILIATGQVAQYKKLQVSALNEPSWNAEKDSGIEIKDAPTTSWINLDIAIFEDPFEFNYETHFSEFTAALEGPSSFEASTPFTVTLTGIMTQRYQEQKIWAKILLPEDFELGPGEERTKEYSSIHAGGPPSQPIQKDYSISWQILSSVSGEIGDFPVNAKVVIMTPYKWTGFPYVSPKLYAPIHYTKWISTPPHFSISVTADKHLIGPNENLGLSIEVQNNRDSQTHIWLGVSLIDSNGEWEQYQDRILVPSGESTLGSGEKKDFTATWTSNINDLPGTYKVAVNCWKDSSYSNKYSDNLDWSPIFILSGPAAAIVANPDSLVSVSTKGDSRAFHVFTSPVGFLTSTHGSSFLVMSTGIAANIPGSPEHFESTDFGAGGTTDDTVSLTLRFLVPDDVSTLSFDFRFMSEEYPEWVGTQYNDFFYAYLTDSTGTHQVAYDDNGNIINVNNNFFNPNIYPIGTVFDGATKRLTTTVDVTPGDTITLHLQIGDAGDGIYDTAVLLDNIRFDGGEVPPGTTPTADVIVVKNAPNSVEQAKQLTYTLSYFNIEEGTAENVVVSDELPPQVDFVSASSGGVYSLATHSVSWNLGTLAPFSSGSLTLTVSIPSETSIGAILENAASITTTSQESSSQNNDYSKSTTVTVGASLPPNVEVGPTLSNYNGIPVLYWTTPTTFAYHGDANVIGVDINIFLPDGGPDIGGPMVNTPGTYDWTFTYTFYPRHGQGIVTYTVHYADGSQDTTGHDILVDPSGYVYNAITGERIEGATVTLFRFDTVLMQFVIVPPDDPGIDPHINPQITDENGGYGWMVSPGMYMVRAEKDGYATNFAIVTVPPPATDLNIPLTPLDTTPPTTQIMIGTPHYIDSLGNTYVTSDTSFTLTADDGPDGSGVDVTYYRHYNLTYDSDWTGYSDPFYLKELEDGPYSIDYYSTDIVGNAEPTNTLDVTLDNTAPEITVSNPPVGWALQDGVTFMGSIVDSGSGVFSMSFSIREANDGDGIPIGFEDFPASYDSSTGEWSFSFDTLLVPDGYYVLYIEAEDNLGNEASKTVPYSIRNWAVIELLPSSEDNKAGRTMPVKFALRVAAEVDPDQPFVYNEELRIEIFATDDPDNVLQESYYGDTARDYRISSVLYITNFKTIKRRPMEYTVAVYRDTFDVGSFTFETVK